MAGGNSHQRRKLRRAMGLPALAAMPNPIPIPKNLPETVPTKTEAFRLSVGDTFTVFGLLVGVLLVIIVPPLILKAILLICVCIGFFLFLRYSHWTGNWSRRKQQICSFAVIALLLGVGVPQFISQWKTEHVQSQPNANQPPTQTPSLATSDPPGESKPILRGKIIQVTTMPLRKDVVPIVLTMKVSNDGADSTASGYRLTVISDSGKSFTSDPEALKGDFTILNPDDGSAAWKLTQKDLLYEKTTSAVVSRGLPRTGPVIYALKKSDIDEVGGIKKAKFKVTVFDYKDSGYDLDIFSYKEGKEPFRYVPGAGGTYGPEKPPKSLLTQPAFTERGDTLMHFAFSGGLIKLTRTADYLRNHRLVNDNGFNGMVFPVTLYAEGDKLYADINLPDQSGKDAIEIKKNEFTVKAAGWDKNSNANALEVVNEVGQVIFQLVRKSGTEMNLEGAFQSNANIACFGDTTIRQVKSLTDCSITRIFKYPSWKYPGKYADGSN